MKFDVVNYQHELHAKMAQADSEVSAPESIRVVSAGKVFRIAPGLVDFIDQMPFITPIPRAQPFVLGSCHARGRILTVLDLSLALGDAPDIQNRKLVAFKSRDLAICAVLAGEQDIAKLAEVDFSADYFGANAHYFLHIN